MTRNKKDLSALNFSVLTFWTPVQITLNSLLLFIGILPIHHPNIAVILSFLKSWQKAFPDSLYYLNVVLLLFLASPNFTNQIFCCRKCSNALKIHNIAYNENENSVVHSNLNLFWNFVTDMCTLVSVSPLSRRLVGVNKSQTDLRRENNSKYLQLFTYMHKTRCPFNLAYKFIKEYLSPEKAFPPAVGGEVCKVLPPDWVLQPQNHPEKIRKRLPVSN